MEVTRDSENEKGWVGGVKHKHTCAHMYTTKYSEQSILLLNLSIEKKL